MEENNEIIETSIEEEIKEMNKEEQKLVLKLNSPDEIKKHLEKLKIIEKLKISNNRKNTIKDDEDSLLNLEAYLFSEITFPALNEVRLCVIKEIEDLKDIEVLIDYECCEQYKSCPLYLTQTNEQFKKCPLERVAVENMIMGLLEELSENSIKITFTDKTIINQLVSLSLIERRILKKISFSNLQSFTVKKTKTSTEYTTTYTNMLDALEKIQLQISKLRKELLTTRESKVKFIEKTLEEIKNLNKRNKQLTGITEESKKALQKRKEILESKNRKMAIVVETDDL